MSIVGYIGSFKVSKKASCLILASLEALAWRIYPLNTKDSLDKHSFFEAAIPVLQVGHELKDSNTTSWLFPESWDAFDDYLYDGLKSAETPVAIFWSGWQGLHECDPNTYQGFIRAVGSAARPSLKTPPLVLFIIGSGEGFSDSAHEVIAELRSLGLSVSVRDRETRLRASVRTHSDKVKHYLAMDAEKVKHYLRNGGEPTGVQQMGLATTVEIIEEGDAYLMIRYDENGQFAGDTWGATIEECKRQALFEFGIKEDDWSEDQAPRG